MYILNERTPGQESHLEYVRSTLVKVILIILRT